MTTLRIATWNIRKAMGTDRRRDPGRIMDIIADLGADAVVLQEADLRLPPRRPVLDAGQIETRTGLRPVLFDHGRSSLGWHGNALLIGPRLTALTQLHHDLPGLEPRGLVEAELAVEDRPFRLFGVHLGLLRASRRSQLSALNAILGHAPDLPALIAGDFNERSLKEGLGRLAPRFDILSGGPTYHARMPLFPLDRIAVTQGFTVRGTEVWRGPGTDRASDHLPLIADLALVPPG